MKSIVLLISFSIFGLLLNVGNDNNKCVLVKKKGVNEIVVDKSTLDDVVAEFGGSINKYWKKGIETEITGHYEYDVRPDSIGIFSTYYPERKNKIVKVIELSNDCKCKTKNGLGIGSSYHETIREFGRPESSRNTTLGNINDSGYKLVLIYDNMRLYFDGVKKDTATIKINWITINSP